MKRGYYNGRLVVNNSFTDFTITVHVFN